MKSQDKAKIAQSIALLQQVLNGGGSSIKGPVPHYPPMSAVDQKFNSFVAQSKALEPELVILTNSMVKYFDLMKIIMGYSAICKKPDEPTAAKLQGLFKEQFKPIQDLEIKEQWKIHAKAIKELVNGTFWVFTNAPEIVLKSAIQAADFNANKFKRNKILPHNEWYNTLVQAFKNLIDYTIENFPSGLNYNFDGKATWDDAISAAHGGVPKSAEQSVKQEVKPEPKKQTVVQPVVKKPVRESKGGNWYIQNYENQEITFNEGEIEMRCSFFIDNCKNLTVRLEKFKWKSLMLNKCEKVVLILGNLLSGVEIMNSKGIEVRVVHSCPSVSIDKSQSIHVVLNGENKNTDIVSSKVTQLNISYTLNAEDIAKDTPVPDQFITRWNATLNRFETKVYDKFM